MLNYLREYGNVSWEERGMTNVDLAEFSQLVYNPFENIENKGYDGCTLREIYPLVYKNGFPPANWSWPQNVQDQWSILAECSRFLDVRLDNFYSKFRPELNEQFAAATFGIGKTGVVVFRGTDLSIVGWKEDLDMGYRAPLPCHHEAIRYLEAEISKYDRLYVVGQSKGGHLAVYAGACIVDKSRIVKVLSLEGPGLDKKVYDEHWNEIEDKVEILLPDTSMIGMMLGYGGNYAVVSSTGKGFIQHDPFTWVVEHGEFKTDTLSKFSIALHRVMHDFVESTSDEERGVLVQTIFRMLDSLGVDDVDSLMKAVMTKGKAPIAVLMKLSSEEKAVLLKLMDQFRQDGIETAKLMVSLNKFKTEQMLEDKKEAMGERFESVRDRIEDKISEKIEDIKNGI